MADLHKLFLDLQRQPAKYLQSSKGGDFENRLETNLHKIGFSRLLHTDIADFQTIKKQCQLLDGNAPIPNHTEFNNHFIVQPGGTQSYPDFMIFDNHIVSIEVKYSAGKQTNPVWNSGLPRPNGIYIFGCYGLRDITFFKGGDVVSSADIKKLHKFFSDLKIHEARFNQTEMSNQPYGFTVYNRKAFSQQKTAHPHAIINFFTNPNRAKLERGVIDYVKNNTVAI